MKSFIPLLKEHPELSELLVLLCDNTGETSDIDL